MTNCRHSRCFAAERVAPAAHLAELVARRLVDDVGVGHDIGHAAPQAGSVCGDPVSESLQRGVRGVGGNAGRRDGDCRVAAGLGAVPDAIAGEQAGVGRPGVAVVLGVVGVRAPDQEPGVQSTAPGQRHVGDAQAVGGRSVADLHAAAVRACAQPARHLDGDPEDLAGRGGARPHRERHQRIGDVAQEAPRDGARARDHGNGELAQHAHRTAAQLRAAGPSQAARDGLDRRAAVDDQLEGGAPTLRRDEQRLPGCHRGRRLELHVGARKPDPLPCAVLARPACPDSGERDGERRREQAAGHAAARRCRAFCSSASSRRPGPCGGRSDDRA